MKVMELYEFMKDLSETFIIRINIHNPSIADKIVFKGHCNLKI